MKNKEDLIIKQLLEAEHIESVIRDKQQLRDVAKTNIFKHQEQSRTQYNKMRKSPTTYKIGDLVTIQRTQFGSGLKLRPKFFGRYKVKAVQPHDRYQVQEVGQHEDANLTSTANDYMTPWTRF